MRCVGAGRALSLLVRGEFISSIINRLKTHQILICRASAAALFMCDTDTGRLSLRNTLRALGPLYAHLCAGKL